jgi:hypothetical protein
MADLTLRVDIGDLTYGDLRYLVKVADQHGVPNSQKVDLVWNDRDDSILDSIELVILPQSSDARASAGGSVK